MLNSLTHPNEKYLVSWLLIILINILNADRRTNDIKDVKGFKLRHRSHISLESRLKVNCKTAKITQKQLPPPGHTFSLALMGDVYCIFVTFPCGILCQVWYLIVSFPDLCHLSYFHWELRLAPNH